MSAPKTERNARMAELYRQGVTAKAIAEQFGVSRTCVTHQLLRAGVAQEIRRLRAEDRPLRQAYSMQRNTAKARGIDWQFDYDTWLACWKASGRLHLRGAGRGKYVMARHGDEGPYAPDNVSFIPFEENVSQGWVNRPRSISSLGRSLSNLGRGRGWTLVRGRYIVVVCHSYIGSYRTQEEAEAAYREACDRHREAFQRMTPSEVSLSNRQTNAATAT